MEAKQNPAAPFLFDEQDLPIREDLVDLIRTEQYRHTGARLLDNEVKALRLVELLTGKWGLKRIAEEMHVSVHSVRAARECLVAQGKLAPYKSRIVAKMEDAIECGLDRYVEALQNGEVAAAQIPVGVGILSDKRALALGEPTSIGVTATAQLDARALSVESLNAWVASLPAAPAVDAPSTVLPQLSPGNPPPVPLSEQPRPAEPVRQADPDPAAPLPGAQVAHSPAAPGARPPGGGSAPPDGSQTPTPSVAPNTA